MEPRKKKRNIGIWVALIALATIIQLNLVFSHSKSARSATETNVKAAQPNQSTAASGGQESTSITASTPQTGDKNSGQPSPATGSSNAPDSPSPQPAPVIEGPIKSVLPFGKLIANVPAKNKTVYLTFDDGPNERTKEMVAVLDKYGVKATFFWIGENIKDDIVPVAKQMVAEGHVIGTHTMHHTSMAHKSLQEQEAIINQTTSFISQKIGAPIVYFRPPYGAVDKNTRIASQDTKQSLIYWEVDSEDWKYPHNPQKILSNIESEVKPNAIILMHEKAWTLELIPKVISILKNKGYELAPLPAPESAQQSNEKPAQQVAK
ncbi:polysaccharide deacetylase family protein [Aneurinibacillus terranovensis]|uniref:polysaccharide deacetylase family protein n=1 Tax=Aneurinibacillus terranovensis TaxID=278991 RepID=UPI0004282690|nr:polysaccharide deacetylase family protein [Aneurinibacillus terranovensis]